MVKLIDEEESSTRRVLLFGAPFTGKTQLAGELANYYDLIYVDMEKGRDVLFKLPVEAKRRIEVINLPDTRSYPIAIETVLKMVKGAVSICDLHGKCGCMLCKREEKSFVDLNLPAINSTQPVVVFDSLTQLTNSAIAHMTKACPDDYKLDWDDYSNLNKLIDIFLSHIQQANYNVVVISHEVEAETEGKKNILVPVAGTRNMSRNVAKYFDDVIYCEKVNNKHKFASSTGYKNNVLSGSRTDISLEDYEVPSLLAIFNPKLYEEKFGKPAPKKDAAAKLNTSSKSNVMSKLQALKAKNSGK